MSGEISNIRLRPTDREIIKINQNEIFGIAGR